MNDRVRRDIPAFLYKLRTRASVDEPRHDQMHRMSENQANAADLIEEIQHTQRQNAALIAKLRVHAQRLEMAMEEKDEQIAALRQQIADMQAGRPDRPIIQFPAAFAALFDKLKP